MLGIILVLLATLAIVFAAHRLGSGTCEPDLTKRDSDRNTSLTVLALGVVFLLSGILALVAGSNNPFAIFVPQQPASSATVL